MAALLVWQPAVTAHAATPTPPQRPGLKWMSRATLADTFIVEGRAVDAPESSPWLHVADLLASRRCIPFVNFRDKTILRCEWGQSLPAGIPRGVFYRLRVAGRTDVAPVELPRLSIVCLKPGSVSATADIGQAAAIWPVEPSVPVTGCP